MGSGLEAHLGPWGKEMVPPEVRVGLELRSVQSSTHRCEKVEAASGRAARKLP